MRCGNAVAAAGSKSRIMRMNARIVITRGVDIVRCKGQHHIHVPHSMILISSLHSPAGLYQAVGWGNASLGGFQLAVGRADKK
jgi:hypothetical protein